MGLIVNPTNNKIIVDPNYGTIKKTNTDIMEWGIAKEGEKEEGGLIIQFPEDLADKEVTIKWQTIFSTTDEGGREFTYCYFNIDDALPTGENVVIDWTFSQKIKNSSGVLTAIASEIYYVWYPNWPSDKNFFQTSNGDGIVKAYYTIQNNVLRVYKYSWIIDNYPDDSGPNPENQILTDSCSPSSIQYYILDKTVQSQDFIINGDLEIAGELRLQ